VYARETLNVSANPRVRIIWQDGRSGLALNDKKYDLITQQPLYLMQAGSSILLSREYLKLAQARLKPGGVMAIYSNGLGNRDVALLVRQTVQSVFRYCESVNHGYLVVASDTPIDISAPSLERRLALYPAIQSDVDVLKTTMAAPDAPFSLSGIFDSPRLAWTGSPYVITDDHPLVEYPRLVTTLLSAARQNGRAF